MRMGRVCDLFCPKLLGAFTTVVLYTHLMMIRNSGRMSPLYKMGVHSTLVSLDHRLRDFFRDDAPVHLQ